MYRSNILSIDVTMTTLSPLFSGEVREKEKFSAKERKISFPVRKTTDNRVIVPFKGALRSALELILSSKNEAACDSGSSGKKPCGNCIPCGLFGSLGRKGRASVDFLRSSSDKGVIVKDAVHTKIDRVKGSVSDSYKGEEVVENAVFTSRILIFQPQGRDLELIKAALKYIEAVGIGGWGNKGYGRVRFDVMHNETTSHEMASL